MHRHARALLAGLLGLGGCVQLEVTELGRAESFEGVPYALPYTTFETALTWRLASCDPVEIAIAADPTAMSLPDPAHRYLIDVNSLSSWFKTSSLEIKRHENGMLKSVNATADDQTGAVIGNLVRTAVGIASIAVGAPVPGVQAAVGPPPAGCTETVRQLLAKAQAAAQELARETDRVATARETVERVNRRIADMGGRPDAATRAELRRALEDLDDGLARHAVAAAAAARALGPITVRRTERWPHDGSRPGAEALRTTVPMPSVEWFGKQPAKSMAELRAGAAVELMLEPVGGASHAWVAGDTRPDPSLGIRYRDAVPSVFAARQVGGAVLAETRVAVHQFGTLFHLPLRNVAFQSNELALEIDASGVLTMARYADKAATAARATGALADLVGGIGAIRQSRQDAKLDRLQRENDLLEAQKKRRELLGALSPPPPPSEAAQRKAAFSAEADLAAAETEAILAEIARREARLRLGN